MTGEARRLRRALACAVAGALVTASLVTVLDGTGGAAPIGGPPEHDPTTVRYEAESYDGAVGTDVADASCSDGNRRSGALAGVIVSVPITLPADVALVEVEVRHATNGTTRGPEMKWDGGETETGSPVTGFVAGGCGSMGTFAYFPIDLDAGAHTLTVSVPVSGSSSLVLDYIDVTYWTPTPTTTTSSTTTTTSSSTTTTTASTTTTTAPCVGAMCTGIAPGGFQGLAWFLALVLGSIFGRVLWGIVR